MLLLLHVAIKGVVQQRKQKIHICLSEPIFVFLVLYVASN